VAHLLVKLGTFHRSLEYLNLIPMTVGRLLEVLDKGKAAAVTTIIETKDVNSGKVIFENQSTVFIRGAGGFGGKRTGKGIACADEPFLTLAHFERPNACIFQIEAQLPLPTTRQNAPLMLLLRRKQVHRRPHSTGM